MIENPYKRLPPLERKPDGTPYRMTPAQRKQANALIRQSRAGMGHVPVVRARLGAVAAQENSPVIRHSRTHQRNQFRVDWNVRSKI